MSPTKPKSGTFFVKGEKITLRRDSTWIADGVEITHEETRRLFYRSIVRDQNSGRYSLRVGYESIEIEVEDTPYFVTEIDRAPDGSILARLTGEKTLPITAKTLSYQRPDLYLKLDDDLRARFLSAPFFDFLRDLQSDETNYFVVIAGERINLAKRNLVD